MKMVHWLDWKNVVKPGFILSVSVFMAKIMNVFLYFEGFPDDVGMVGPDIDYDLGSVEIGTVFCVYGV
jgi:hypothetical protein